MEASLNPVSLGKLKDKETIIKFKEDEIQNAEGNYNIPNAYNLSTKKKIKCKVQIIIVKKLEQNNDNDITWTAPTLAFPKKIGDT